MLTTVVRAQPPLAQPCPAERWAIKHRPAERWAIKHRPAKRWAIKHGQ